MAHGPVTTNFGTSAENEMVLSVSKSYLGWAAEVEEGCRAVVREVFQHFMLGLECVLGFMLNSWDGGYARSVEAHTLRSRSKRRYWARTKESSLNDIVAGRTDKVSQECSIGSVMQQLISADPWVAKNHNMICITLCAA